MPRDDKLAMQAEVNRCPLSIGSQVTPRSLFMHSLCRRKSLAMHSDPTRRHPSMCSEVTRVRNEIEVEAAGLPGSVVYVSRELGVMTRCGGVRSVGNQGYPEVTVTSTSCRQPATIINGMCRCSPTQDRPVVSRIYSISRANDSFTRTAGTFIPDQSSRFVQSTAASRPS